MRLLLVPLLSALYFALYLTTVDVIVSASTQESTPTLQ
jgi:hypothetical protein